jgi:type IV pilus assembly protein PilF
MALCALDNQQFVKADQYFEMSYKHNPARSTTVVSLAGIKYAMGDLVAALDFLNRYNRLRQPTSRGALLGYILETKRGRLTQANKYASQLRGEYANSREAIYLATNDIKSSEFEVLKRDYKQQSMGTSGAKPQIKITRKNAEKGKSIPVTPIVRQGLKTTENLANAVSSVSAYKREIQETVDMFSAPLTDTEKVDLPDAEQSMVTLAKDTPLPKEEVLVEEIAPQIVVNDRALTDKENAYLKIDEELVSLPTHKVEEGDNLFRISTKYNIKITSLIFWNQLDKEELVTGQSLIVADPSSVMAVESDIMISDVASKHDIKVNDLLGWNGLDKDGWLKAGSKIRLTQPIGYKETAKVEDSYLELNPISVTVPTHTVQGGEFLYTISRKYNIKISALMRWNDMKSESDIRVGQDLYVANPDIFYVVKNGGKLSDVANKLNIELSKLKSWNQVQHDGRLKKGTKVLVVDIERYQQ